MICHIPHAYLPETPKVHEVSSRIDQAVLSEPIAASNPNIRRTMSKFFGRSPPIDHHHAARRYEALSYLCRL